MKGSKNQQKRCKKGLHVSTMLSEKPIFHEKKYSQLRTYKCLFCSYTYQTKVINKIIKKK